VRRAARRSTAGGKQVEVSAVRRWRRQRLMSRPAPAAPVRLLPWASPATQTLMSAKGRNCPFRPEDRKRRNWGNSADEDSFA
jgi:hypothetical protein